MTYVLFFRESPVWHVLKVVLGVAVVIKVSKDVSDILLKVIEWESDCFEHFFQLYHGEAFFSAISWREQVNFQRDDDEVHFVLDQHS